VSKELFAAALAVGAGLLAIWIHTRFPDLGPEKPARLLLHLVLAMVLLNAIPGTGGSTIAAYAVVFGFVLPALVYTFLATIWLLLVAQRGASAFR
jgi:hypothetical protein